MVKIEYSSYPFRIREEGDKEVIFDEIRKVWLQLTPEEWVRQNFVHYLISAKNYPSTLVALEKKIIVGEMAKRFDIVVYDSAHHPWMMVECKSMNVALSEDVLRQVLRYHIAVPVSYLVITNGTYCMAFEKKDGKLVEIDNLPEFQQ